MANDEAIKDFALDMTSRPAAHAYQERMAAPANVDEMDQCFVKQFGRPQNDQILILPLLLKDKVAALLYADGGAAGLLDAASLEVLVMATSAWLEVASLRKQAHKDATDHSGAAEQPPAAAPVHAASSFSDPFAGHAPHHAAAAPTPVQHAAETLSASSAAAATGLAPDHWLAYPPPTPRLTARLSASPVCWWMKSSSTTRPKWPKAAATRISTTA